MRARIFQPTRSAMSSGLAQTKSWVLEFAPAAARDVDPLMVWTLGVCGTVEAWG